ncbi:sulfotransferase [soil metagenome]
MLPNLLIIGAQKCGTTSLHRYLKLHPEVSMSVPKELDFFVVPDERVLPVGNWSRGLDWYRSHFTEQTRVRGETSPNYTVYPFAEGVAERAASVVPDAKIIYLVRDPIDRIVSHYLHRVEQGEERRPLDDALADINGEGPGMTLVYRSMYFMQIERWTRCFPGTSVLVLAQEDLKAERAATLVRVFRFLGVDPSFSHEGFEARSNVSLAKRPPTRAGAWLRRERRGAVARAMPARLRRRAASVVEAFGGSPVERRPVVSDARREQLEGLLGQDADRLRAFTGHSFPTWSV